jgi:hypothetical protein
VGNKPLLYRYLWLAVVAFVTLTATAYIRHSLIEPVSMGVYCESSSSWACMIRRLAIEALQQTRLAWIAFSLVAIAYYARAFSIALLAWAVACAGLVLYTAELCSLGLLLAGLVAIGGRKRKATTSTGRATQSQ